MTNIGGNEGPYHSARTRKFLAETKPMQIPRYLRDEMKSMYFDDIGIRTLSSNTRSPRSHEYIPGRSRDKNRAPFNQMRRRRLSAPLLRSNQFDINRRNMDNEMRHKIHQNHTKIVRKLENIWRKVVVSNPRLGKRVVKQLIATSDTFRQHIQKALENHEIIDKAEVGKQLLFWLTACIAKIHEPHLIVEDLKKLETMGIDVTGFEIFLKRAGFELSKNAQFDFRVKETWDNASLRLKTLLNPPTCDDCGFQMKRKIPKLVKPANTKDPFRGFNYERQTRHDTVAYCEECRSKLIYDDLYFACPECGPNGIIRVVRGGKLKKIVKRRRGSSVCLQCVPKMIQLQTFRGVPSLKMISHKSNTSNRSLSPLGDEEDTKQDAKEETKEDVNGNAKETQDEEDELGEDICVGDDPLQLEAEYERMDKLTDEKMHSITESQDMEDLDELDELDKAQEDSSRRSPLPHVEDQEFIDFVPLPLISSGDPVDASEN